MSNAGAARRGAAVPQATPRRAKRKLVAQVATLDAIVAADLRREVDADLDDEPDDLTSDDELYEDAPEEANDHDDDGLDDLAPDEAVTGTGRARPAIVFEPFLRAVPAFARVSDGLTGNGMRARVHTANPDADARGRDIGDAGEQDSLERIAAALLTLQPDAIEAPSRLDAFLRLRPMQQQRLAQRVRLDTATISRHTNTLIACPWGVCRLQFFTWRAASGHADNHRRTSELVELVAAMRAHPMESNVRLGTIAATKANPGAASTEIAKRADALRKLIPPVTKLLSAPGRVELAWSRFPDVSDEQAQAMLGLDGDRGLLLARMVLAGAFR